MADAAAARREARRRRILENSHNRLQLISGKAGEDSLKGKFSYSGQNNESPSSTSGSGVFCLPPVNNGAVAFETESHELLSTPQPQDSIAAGDTDLANDLASLLSQTPDSTQTKASTWEKLVSYKYDVVLLALLNQIMYSLFIFETVYFFLPLIIYSITKIIWFPTQGNSNFANAFLLLNGISADRVRTIMNVSQWFGVISQDVCVYLFTTICTQSLLILFNDLLT